MNNTVSDMLNWLEQSENEDQIKHLAYLENLKYVEGMEEQIRGVGSTHFTKSHMGAFIELAKCASKADIAAFRQTEYFEIIKNAEMEDGWQNLEQFKELEKLKYIQNH